VELVFWSSLAIITYVYLGYPVLLMLVRAVAAHSIRKEPCEPALTLIIAAHNESDRIEAKLRNCFELDYPREKLQVVISLDGPTDGTECIAFNYLDRGAEVIYSREHRGKAAALNAAMDRAKGDIVVFADVRQAIDRAALRQLVANFADDRVGAVSGELVLLEDSGAVSTSALGLYWLYEKAVRCMESDIHSSVGATGAIYAIRRSLLRPLPDETILDDVVIPMRVVFSGYRVIVDPSVRAYDIVSCCPLAEYSRKVRTLAGNYQLLTLLPDLFIPWRNPVFLQFMSHKVGRLVVPWLLLSLFASNLFLIRQSTYLLAFIMQACWYALALAGHFLAQRDLTEPLPMPRQSKRTTA
jgi:cellulose synthase/poly-beta-1,6-N-acetylglucosamine synthase-like glycosyltransferase